jgi:MFS family permease
MNKPDKKIFGVLFLSIFTTSTGVGIVVPFLPVYARDLGASGMYISMIFGAFCVSRTILLPYFGRVSDQKGRKPFIVAGLLGYALVSLAFVFATSIEALLVIRFIQGAASAMIMPVAQAYIGDISPKGREGFFMGLFNLSLFLSLSIGPLIGGFISDGFSIQTAFACMGWLSLISFLLSLFFLPSVKEEQESSNENSTVAWGRLLRDPIITGLFVVRLVYVTCIGIIWCFLPIFADQEFGLSSSKIGILVMLPILISGIMQTPMGILADRLNKKNMIIIGSLITGCAILLLQWATGFWDIFWANLLFGIGGGIAMPPLMAWSVIKGKEAKAMGSVMGLLTMGHSIGMMLGSLLAGFTMDLFELRNAFPAGAMLMILGGGFFILCTNIKKLPVGNSSP